MEINIDMDKPLTSEILEEMNIGQLQAIINDLYCLIEGSFFTNYERLFFFVTE